MIKTAAAVTVAELGVHAGALVTLSGWVYGRRSGGRIQFLQVRDGTGICQCIVEAEAAGAFAVAEGLSQEASVRVSGIVRPDVRAAGGFELAVTAIEPIGGSVDYPITPKPHGIDFLMSHRHLWLRSRRPSAILRVRHTLIRAIRDYFDGLGFTLVDTPILSSGIGEDAQTLFPVDYFGDTLYLTQTGQLYLESACMALRKVYCFGPTFRAEKSKTRRHLTEFWMVEPEIAFADLEAVMELAEGLIVACVSAVLERNRAELLELGRDLAPLERVCRPFAHLTYSAAVECLRSDATQTALAAEYAREQQACEALRTALAACEERLAAATKAWQKDKLLAEVADLRERLHDGEEDQRNRPRHMELARQFEWGKDLGGSDETILSRQFDRPLFVTHYPVEAKAFYMKRCPSDPRVVLNMDLLAPEGYGEIIGGSQREDDLAALERAIRLKGLKPESYGWYMDLRRYGSVPHGGFGLGVERTLAWICGLRHVRETHPFPRTIGRVFP